MANKEDPYFSNDVVLFPLAFVFVMWVVFWVESKFHLNFNNFGVYPLTISGLKGILFGPFIHGNVEHIFNNSIPIFVLTAALFYFYRSLRWQVLIYGILLTGLATWLIGRPANHIGASGVVYMLAAFLFFKGILSKQYQLTALSLVVVFLYGSLLWYLFPIDPKISWEGHASGFIVGIIFALIFRKNTMPIKKFEWQREDYDPEEDPFMNHFDADGNFIEKLSEIEIEPLEIKDEMPLQIHYHFKKDKDE